jgi:hypothetical protein
MFVGIWAFGASGLGGMWGGGQRTREDVVSGRCEGIRRKDGKWGLCEDTFVDTRRENYRFNVDKSHTQRSRVLKCWVRYHCSF